LSSAIEFIEFNVFIEFIELTNGFESRQTMMQNRDGGVWERFATTIGAVGQKPTIVI
jgi:hypothetical protein